MNFMSTIVFVLLLSRAAALGGEVITLAKSTSRGRAAHTMCQLVTGSLSRAALTRVFQLGGAEAAWSHLFGFRRLRTLSPKQ